MFRTFLLYNIFYDLKTPFLKFLHFARNHFSEFSMWNNFSFLISFKMFHVEHFCLLHFFIFQKRQTFR